MFWTAFLALDRLSSRDALPDSDIDCHMEQRYLISRVTIENTNRSLEQASMATMALLSLPFEWCRGVVVSVRTHDIGAVTSNPACVTIKTTLVRKAMANKFEGPLP